MPRLVFLSWVALLIGITAVPAQNPPSYVRDIRPFLNKYCLECHPAKDPDGDLSLDSYANLMKGSKRKVIIAGRPDASLLVLTLEGKSKPAMPPKKSPQPSKEEIARVRAWVAAGAKDDSAGNKGQVWLPAIKPRQELPPPVATLAFQPAGRGLAVGAGNAVILLDSRGQVTAALTDQPGKVSALAYSPSGELVVAAGDTGVPGQLRLYRQGKAIAQTQAHADSILALAFSPDGKLLASCGYDRLIRLWDASTLKPLRELRDHSDSVYDLAFSPDSKLLASAGADRAVKVWDTASGKRLYTLGESTDWVYAVAWRPDGKEIAAGGVDRSIRVWEVTTEGGKVAHSVFAHAGAVSRLRYSDDGKILYSLGETGLLKAWDADRMTERKVFDRQSETPLSLAVSPDQKLLAVGRYDGLVVLLDALTGKTLVQVQPKAEKAPKTRFDPVEEVEPNDSPRTGQPVTLPASIQGSLARIGEVDFYRLSLEAGQQVGVQALTPGWAGKMAAHLAIIDPDGDVAAASDNGVLGFTAPRKGIYSLGIREQTYAGEAGAKYQLDIGDIPVVTSVFPLGVQRGRETEVFLEGVHLGERKSVRIKPASDAVPGSRLPLRLNTPRGQPLGEAFVVVGEFPESLHEDREVPMLPIDGTGNGRIGSPGASQVWKFPAKKGQPLLVEITARRLGSPLDSYLEILDEKGNPVPRAVLRSVARTFSTFRDHDSASPGIRLEAWSELAVNDYIWYGNSLIRIRALPRNPDDDCQFFSDRGQRKGYLDTTPGQLANGTPLYKVTIHPPGTTFPPSAFPVVHLNYQNDDGPPEFGKDSRITFDPPADGIYQVRVSDARGEGSSRHAYRLTVRRPRPDFRVSFSPSAPAVWQGGAVPVTVNVERIDGFAGEVRLRFENIPAGFGTPVSNVPAEEASTVLSFFAEASATAPDPKSRPMRLIASARINGQEITREAVGGLPSLLPAGDINPQAEQTEVKIRPGGETRLTVRVERRAGFNERVPLEVRSLPHGVRVLDVGLNGILVLPGQNTRTMVLHAEPWVQPMEHPIVIVARREPRRGEKPPRQSDHAARPVLLKVVK